MEIRVTLADVTEAEKRVACADGQIFKDPDLNGRRPLHAWNNPVSVALERIYGEPFYASISYEWISLSHRHGDSERVLALSEVHVYLREWCNRVAGEHVFILPLRAPSQFIK